MTFRFFLYALKSGSSLRQRGLCSGKGVEFKKSRGAFPQRRGLHYGEPEGCQNFGPLFAEAKDCFVAENIFVAVKGLYAAANP